jgi:hypothetical protein
VRLAAECLLIGLHADFLGIADANRGGRNINAERVVTELLTTQQLLPHQRLLYRDTLGRWDELVHDGRRFKSPQPSGNLELATATGNRAAGGVQPTSVIRFGGGVHRDEIKPSGRRRAGRRGLFDGECAIGAEFLPVSVVGRGWARRTARGNPLGSSARLWRVYRLRHDRERQRW